MVDLPIWSVLVPLTLLWVRVADNSITVSRNAVDRYNFTNDKEDASNVEVGHSVEETRLNVVFLTSESDNFGVPLFDSTTFQDIDYSLNLAKCHDINSDCYETEATFNKIQIDPAQLLSKSVVQKKPVRYYLFTRNNPEEPVELTPWDKQSVANSPFDVKLPVKIVIPGWIDSYAKTKWVRDIIAALLKYRQYNVIYVEWPSLITYYMASKMSRIVGEYLGDFIYYLKNVGQVRGENIHLIGHSIGAHIAGYAGKFNYGAIGRISALDPARPLFQEKLSEMERLNRFNAQLVDVIHSDMNDFYSLGFTLPMGDVDFFPNGKSPQPGCDQDRLFRGLMDAKEYGPIVGFEQAKRYSSACSHQRSHEWFLESLLNEQCTFIGVKCSDYKSFTRGDCSCDDSDDACIPMGIATDQHYFPIDKLRQPQYWFMATNEKSLYCASQYSVVVQLGIQKWQNSIGASFDLILHSHSENTTRMIFLQLKNSKKLLSSGSKVGYLLLSDETFINIHSISFIWKPRKVKGEEIIVSELRVKYIKISPFVKTRRRQKVTKYYCSSYKNIPMYELHTFYERLRCT